MAETYKILGQVAPTVADQEKVLYSSPASTQTLVTNVTVTNRSASTQTFDLNVYNTAKVDSDFNAVATRLFVTVSSNSTTAASSTDGITWTTRTLPTNDSWTGLTFGNNTFVAVAGGFSTAASSTDGITWAARTLPAEANWRATTFGNNTFVAVANDSTTAATSTDGITWTLRTLPSSGSWISLASRPSDIPSSPSINNLYKSATISANQTAILEPGITLGAQNSIVVSGNTNLSYSAYGVELS